MSSQDKVLTISILTPANAPIGLYTLNLQIFSHGKEFTLKLGTFILLFNPWLQGKHQTVHISSHQVSSARGKEMRGMILMGSGLIMGSLWDMERA